MGAPDMSDGGCVDVPPDDYRAIRRAILDLTTFYARPFDSKSVAG